MEVCKPVLVIASVAPRGGDRQEGGRGAQDHHDDRCDDLYLMIIMVIRRVCDSSTGDF